MNDVQVLVDFENVQPSFEDLLRLAPGLSSLWLFHGPHQTKLAQQFKAEHDHVTLVPISKTGKNALDFHLSFYLGYVAARHPDAKLVVVANDKGYDPMILHASTLGFDARRVDTKAKVARTAPKPKVAKPARPAGPVAPAKKAPPRKPAAKTTAVEKPVAQAVKAVPAKKAAKQQAPAVKAPAAKKAPAGGRPQAAAVAPAKEKPVKAVAAKARSAKAAPEKATPVKVAVKKAANPQPKADRATTEATLARVTAGLARMGARRPEKLKSLLRHLGSMLGKDAGADEVQDLVHRLAQAGVIRVSVDGVSYREA